LFEHDSDAKEELQSVEGEKFIRIQEFANTSPVAGGSEFEEYRARHCTPHPDIQAVKTLRVFVGLQEDIYDGLRPW
jgi:hypothetical protein